MEAHILPYGAIMQKLLVPDATGTLQDVALGFDQLEPYQVSCCLAMRDYHVNSLYYFRLCAERHPPLFRGCRWQGGEPHSKLNFRARWRSLQRRGKREQHITAWRKGWAQPSHLDRSDFQEWDQLRSETTVPQPRR